mmetsp:Transcript_7036/g.20397  ORF Transcript_7036/g.20397 Transcript_7036/m.20397 type:complete len:206 (-) Transcript_7036:1600-2217(-)
MNKDRTNVCSTDVRISTSQQNDLHRSTAPRLLPPSSRPSVRRQVLYTSRHWLTATRHAGHLRRLGGPFSSLSRQLGHTLKCRHAVKYVVLGAAMQIMQSLASALAASTASSVAALCLLCSASTSALCPRKSACSSASRRLAAASLAFAIRPCSLVDVAVTSTSRSCRLRQKVVSSSADEALPPSSHKSDASNVSKSLALRSSISA